MDLVEGFVVCGQVSHYKWETTCSPATLQGKFKDSRDWWPAPRSGGLVADPKQPKQIMSV